VLLRVSYGLGCLQAWFHALDLYNLLESRGSGRSCSGLVGYVYDAFPLVALVCCIDEPYISLMLNLILSFVNSLPRVEDPFVMFFRGI
jgi:hypothetical protein